MDYKAFARRTKHKSFDKVVHEGKRKAQELLEDQGVSAMALFISEMMTKSIEVSRKKVSAN